MILSILSKLHVPYILAESEKKFVSPIELDIYYEPPTQERVVVVEEPSALFESVSLVRQKITKAYTGFLTTHEKVDSVFTGTEAFLRNAYKNSLAEPAILLKPSTIALAVITGALVAGKGRRPIKRVFYSSLFGVTAAAVWNPERAKDIAITAYYHSTTSLANLNNLWKTSNKEKVTRLDKNDQNDNVEDQVIVLSEIGSETLVIDSVLLPETKEVSLKDKDHLVDDISERNASDGEEKNEVSFVKLWTGISPDDESLSSSEISPDYKSSNSSENGTEFQVDKNKDFGQSDPEDQDMYSTRSPN